VLARWRHLSTPAAALVTPHSRQAYKPSPPLEFAAEFDVVFAGKRQFAVLANVE
jgi:hypothetical protein